MKNLFLFFYAFLLAQNILGQNTLILKSGEKMVGKIERFNRDTLTFSFKNNRIKFKSTEILAIYFTENLNDNLKSNFVDGEKKLVGKVSGVVTYFFNDNYGDKPDIGAHVFIVDSLKVPTFKYATVDSSYKAKSAKTLYDTFSESNKINEKIKIPISVINEVKNYGVETQEAFDVLDKKAAKELLKLEMSDSTIKLVVDGNGTVQSEVQNGTYYIYVISNHRKGICLSDKFGKNYLKKVVIKTGESVNFSTKFSIY